MGITTPAGFNGLQHCGIEQCVDISSRCSRCSAWLVEDNTSIQRTSSRSTEETCSAVADSDVVRLTARANSTPRARSGFPDQRSVE